jgi:hypothetical protein
MRTSLHLPVARTIRTFTNSYPAHHCPLTPPTQCFQSINQRTNIQSASDGAVLPCQGFQGWLLVKIDNEVLIQGFGATDGQLDDVSSYRG